MALAVLLGFLVTLVLILLASFKSVTSKNAKQKRIEKVLERIPGPQQLPFIGSSYVFLTSAEDILNTLMSLGEKYGRRYKIRCRGTYAVWLDSAEDVAKILCSTTSLTKPGCFRLLRDWLGEGLLLSTGLKWRHRRKLVTPAFHFQILNKFMSSFNEHFRTMTLRLEQSNQRRASHDLFNEVYETTLDVIIDTAMGFKVNRDSDQGYFEYRTALHRYMEIIVYRGVRPWLNKWLWQKYKLYKESVLCVNALNSFASRIIKKRRAQKLETTNMDLNSLLDILLEHQAKDQKQLLDIDVLHEVNTFILGGHDTTTSLLQNLLVLLGTQMDHQARIHLELDNIFGDDVTRDVTGNDLVGMKYMESCIKECLRLYPPLAIIGRVISEDIILDDGTVIPAGCEALLSPYVVHRDPQIYPNPQEFQPERFSSENSAGRHPYAYIPFSAGPRNCIGQKFAMMEMKTALAWLFRVFSIRAIMPPGGVHREFLGVIKTTPDVQFELIKR